MIIGKRAKQAAAFAGSMRTNLLQMLDELGVPRRLGLDSASDLFGCGWDLIHTTSILRYPVFLGDMERNYTGHNPRLATSAFLRAGLQEWFVPGDSSDAPSAVDPIGARSILCPGGIGASGVCGSQALSFLIPQEPTDTARPTSHSALSICTGRSLTISNRPGLPSNPCKRPRGRGAPRLLAGAKLLVAKQWKRRFVRAPA